MVVEERWACDAESKRILDEYATKIEEEKKRQAKKEALSRANISHNKLLLKYLQLKDFLRDCYPEVWKEFRNGTETEMS